MDRIFYILNDIEKTLASMKVGDRVKNINTECTHYGSEGVVENIEPLPDDMGYIVSYRTTNSGSTWKQNEVLKKTKDQLSKAQELDSTMSQNFDEYKMDLYNMSLSSLKSIQKNVTAIVSSVETNENVKKNLTETWLQGKIAVVDDQLRSIHDFVMYTERDDDTSDAGSKPGLWENIRKKKEREGKNYKPAKRGDEDRPDPKQWKKLTKKKDK